MKECFRVLDRAIEGREFIVGDRFTAADVMIASGLIWLDARHHLLNDFPSLDAYAKRMLARPSFQRAFTPPTDNARL
jgi:glutathione S-transferase